jgi:glutathione peroxidase
MSSATSFYDLKPADKGGNPFDFADLKGKVVLVVNVASKCGFTPQYKGLEELYKKYKDEGLVILGFPCNQFGHQEPGSQEEIASFCQLNYGVTFPVLHKIDVNGAGADPVYQYLKEKKPGILGFKGIKWNFEKFLIDRDGTVVERWASTTSPSSIDPVVKKYLEKAK